jgi:hypothetical protein
MSKNRRVSAAHVAYYHRLMGMQEEIVARLTTGSGPEPVKAGKRQRNDRQGNEDRLTVFVFASIGGAGGKMNRGWTQMDSDFWHLAGCDPKGDMKDLYRKGRRIEYSSPGPACSLCDGLVSKSRPDIAEEAFAPCRKSALSPERPVNPQCGNVRNGPLTFTPPSSVSRCQYQMLNLKNAP